MKTSLRSRLAIAKRNFSRSRIPPGIGHSFTADVKARLPNLQIRTIFDVGANIGLVSLELADAFPFAQVHAFEPGTNNFTGMEPVLAGRPDIKRHKIALSDKPGSLRLLIEPEHPSMARLSESEQGPSEQVQVDTIDQFCGSQGIYSIGLIKIDTEGHEMGVLRGAQRMLENGEVYLVKLECTADPDNAFHTQFSEIYSYLRQFGYKLFGIYDQSENPLHPSPELQRFDACFISAKAVRSGR